MLGKRKQSWHCKTHSPLGAWTQKGGPFQPVSCHLGHFGFTRPVALQGEGKGSSREQEKHIWNCLLSALSEHGQKSDICTAWAPALPEGSGVGLPRLPVPTLLIGSALLSLLESPVDIRPSSCQEMNSACWQTVLLEWFYSKFFIYSSYLFPLLLPSATFPCSSQNTELLKNWELICKNPRGSYYKWFPIQHKRREF